MSEAEEDDDNDDDNDDDDDDDSGGNKALGYKHTPHEIPPDEILVHVNSFSVTLQEGAEPHAVAHDLGCVFMAKVLEYFWFRCGPDREHESISPPMALPYHEAVLDYRQLTAPNPKYFSEKKISQFFHLFIFPLNNNNSKICVVYAQRETSNLFKYSQCPLC